MTRIVRQGAASDAAAVRTVARESWHAAYDGFLGRETVETVVDDWYAVGRLEASITDAADRPDAAFLVAEVGGEREREGEGEHEDESERERTLVGFVHVVPESDDRTVASLVRLYVHPDYWGAGIGTALIERAIETLETRYDRLRLEVFADNEVGVRFYEARDFERVGEHEETFEGETQTVYTYERALEGE